MSPFEKIWFGTWGLLGFISFLYWGNLAWFHSDKLKKRLMEHAQHHPDWLFMKGYTLKFSDKYGILMMRFTTLLVAIMILMGGILITLKNIK
jgi:hypothetical protein